MPPLTRSSFNGSRRQAQTLNIHEDDPEMPLENDFMEEEEPYDDDLFSPPEDSQSPPPTTTRDILQPLQETANRVSRQVEEFAKCLDRFNEQRTTDDQDLWEDAWQLIEEFSKIAEGRALQTASNNSKSGRRKGSRNSGPDYQRLELEADIWMLIKNLLVCDSPQSLSRAQENQDSRLKDVHRYTSNTELWNAFLDSDILGQEYEGTLAWLQERAARSSPTIEEALEDVFAKAERGDGVWSAGPMYTKTAIKAEKRKRAWPLPLDLANPGLSMAHKRPTDGMELVAQLDPDAQTREGASLQLQDEAHEEGSWRTCWEMLRRGFTIKEIREWWIDRKEIWRSALIQGCDISHDQPLDSPWLRIINLASNAEWIECCQALCQNDPAYEYQVAVYGLLCGNASACRPVCKTIDDHLFSILNALLVDRYQNYLLAFRKKLAHPNTTVYQPKAATTDQIRKYLKYAQTAENTRKEAHQPHKFIEMAVMGKDFDAFFVQLGQAAAQVAHSSGEFSHLMYEDSSTPISECHRITAQNQDCVRIAVHLQLVLGSLGLLDDAYQNHTYEMENNIANYIGWLEKEKKFTLIPLYAGRLCEERIRHILGAVLVKVVEPKERKEQVHLMKQYNIKVSDVVYGIFYLANYEKIDAFRSSQIKFIAPKITEKHTDGSTKMTKIKADFMSGELTPAEEKAIQSVEWYEFIDAENWSRAAWSVSFLYKLFLYEGRFGALRDLMRRCDLAKISLSAVSMNLNFADESDDASENGDLDISGSDEDRPQSISPHRKRKPQKTERPHARSGVSRAVLFDKSQVWKQLEQLVNALDTIERWQDWADDLESNRANAAQMRTLKRELKKVFEEVREAILPLMDGDFLCQANDEKEQIALNEIRNHYIPECILAYNAVLFFAGHALSRSYLAECMTLAEVVAQTPMLTNAFVESGRMRELVTAFAVDSQALLHANEQGAPKTKKGKKTAGTEIWQVSWKGKTPADVDYPD